MKLPLDIPDYIFPILALIILYLGFSFLCNPRFSGVRYKVTDKGINIYLFRIPFYKVPYSNIVSAEILPARNLFAWAIYWHYSIWAPSRCWGTAIRIEKKGRIFTSIIMTPDDAESFLAEINKHLIAADVNQSG
jgi:hypothetical protein